MLTSNKIYHDDFFLFYPKISPNTIDLIICDGPYGITEHQWDKTKNIQKFNLQLLQIFSKILKEGGALYLFGKHNCIDFIDYNLYLNLKAKIVWYQPSRLAQGRINYTNNYDIICYFIKGKIPHCFELDDIRVSQLVELQHRQRCENVPSVKQGAYQKTKYHKKGKNPGDVWGDIKQLTYKSKELINREVLNTIQKPKKLMKRLIKASSKKGDLVLDPFAGVATSAVVCQSLERNFIAIEQDRELVEIGNQRLFTNS